MWVKCNNSRRLLDCLRKQQRQLSLGICKETPKDKKKDAQNTCSRNSNVPWEQAQTKATRHKRKWHRELVLTDSVWTRKWRRVGGWWEKSSSHGSSDLKRWSRGSGKHLIDDIWDCPKAAQLPHNISRFCFCLSIILPSGAWCSRVWSVTMS